MKPKEFVNTFYPFAKETEIKTGFPALAILAQCAVESALGAKCPGNMMFGIKDFDGINGNEQLITTFEYNSKYGLSPTQVGLKTIESIIPVILNGKKFYKYAGKAYFRKYNSPEESFTDHANFLLKNKRYAKAIGISDPYKFIDAIASAGYAQSPTYATLLKSVAKMIEKNII